jgi:hypothetical protein
MTNKYLQIPVIALLLFTASPAQNKNDNGHSFAGRAKSFFGLHFDFHAVNTDNQIGKNFFAETIDSLLTIVKPDYIQVDCKGHAGISSYPTIIGNPAPGFIKDPYPIWRQLTAKHGVGLFVHYSGILDYEAVKNHPEWSVVNKEGKIVPGKNSVRGPYVDKILIPQMKELIDNYKIDGAWIDGESWALEPDYSNYMLDAFCKETGITNVPRSQSDKNWLEFRNFNRDSFRKYIAHYVDELHAYDPHFQLTSNWAFSSLIPKPVDVNIDFISGDFDPNNSLYSGLFESRCIASQGKPWDLMVWGFTHDDNGCHIYKSPVQLQQAAAAVISMGGGFQIYSTQNRDASIKPWLFNTFKNVANFCRERQPFCQYAKPVPQIALLFSTANFERTAAELYNSGGRASDAVRGMLNMLLDTQNAVEILMEHHLEKRINEYPLVVIPEVVYLDENFRKILLDYVNAGGNLLVAGAEASKMFAAPLGVELTDTASVCMKYLDLNGLLTGVRGLFQPFKTVNSVEKFRSIYNEPDFRSQSYPAVVINSYGKGKIAGIFFNFCRSYVKLANPVYRNFINSVVQKLFPAPKVETKGSENLLVTINKLNNKLLVNLINMSGPHANIRVARYDSIPSIGPIEAKIKTEKKPKKVTLQPENIPLKYSYSNGIIKTKVEKIDVHSIIVVEQ